MRPLLGNGAVNTFLWQQINTQNRGTLGSGVFCAVHAKAIQRGPTGKVR
jgi:hypothetical protein